MPWFGQELFVQTPARGDSSDNIYGHALARSKSLAGTLGIDAALKKYKVGCVDRTDRWDGVGHRLDQRRSRERQQFNVGGGGRLPRHHRTRWLRPRPVGRIEFFRHRLE